MNIEVIQIQSVLFYLFAGIAVASALGVVLHRNPISAAILLVLTFFALAGIYAVMGAFFIATMQVLVYAGAIMVLVVFVLMLLSLREENISKLWANPGKKVFLMAIGICLLLVFSGLIRFGVTPSQTQSMRKGVSESGAYQYELKTGSESGQSGVNSDGNVASVGAHMFLDYLIPFELISILLLVAVLGAVILAKKSVEEGR